MLPTRSRLAGFYLLLFMGVGVSLPFFPQYFRSLGFSGPQIGALLAVGPAFALVMPPLWGQLADRTGRPGLLLGVLMTGAAGGLVALWFAPGFGGVLLALCLFATFNAPVTTMIDTLTLKHLEREGGTYARIRLFGSLGFVLGSFGFGVSVEQIDHRAVAAALACVTAAALWAWVMLAGEPAVHSEGPRPSLKAALELLGQKEIWVFLIASALHWIACAPYHGILSLHVTALKLAPWVVSASASVGVAAEVAVMVTWPRWAHRLSPRNLLILAFVASSGRWLGMAYAERPLAFVFLAAIHGLTFGAFYLAAVAWMAERAPGSLRATGQAMFVAATFGLGGLAGYLGTGVGYDALGGHRLFAVAAGAALLPALMMLLVNPRPARASA